MNVFITGGAGFLGINLVRYLLSKNITRIKVIDIADFNYPELQKITFLKADIRNPGAWEYLLKEADIVIHTAAALPLYSKDDIYSTEVSGTEDVLEAAYKNNVKRFIHISSTAVYGIPDHHPLYETDRLQGVGAYGEAKILAEEACLKYRKKGMVVSILRPKSFIGPERLGVFALLYDWADSARNFPVLGSGNNRYQFLDVEDLCAAIYLCMTQPDGVVNDVFNIGAKKFTTIKEDYQAVLDYAGFGKKIIGFPAGPAILLLRILEFFHLSPLYKWIYETVDKDSFVSIEKSEKILGFSPVFSNQDALIRNFKWYRENRQNFVKSSGVSHRVPWKQGILAALKIFF